jgi:hypothetical protein
LSVETKKLILPEQIEHGQHGARDSACSLAASAGLWAEALIIASHVNQDVYRDVVMKFTSNGLGRHRIQPEAPANLYDSLKIMMRIFSGAGEAASNLFY